MNKHKFIAGALSLCLMGGVLSSADCFRNANAAFTWVDDYSSIISNYALEGEFSYAAIHIDDDNIPEILVYDPNGNMPGGIYTYTGDKAVKIAEIDGGSWFLGFEEATGIFGLHTQINSNFISSNHYVFYKLENGSAKVVCDLKDDYYFGAGEDGSDIEECTVNGESVTYSELRDIRYSYTDNFSYYPEYDYIEMHSLINDTLKLGYSDTETIDYTFSEDGTLLIEGSGDMPDFDWVSRATGGYEVSVNWADGKMPPWYNFRNLITRVIIGEGITSIGKNAFTDCDRLESISIPSTITYIGESAFYSCSKLESVRIPDGVSTIYSDTFSRCDSMKITEAPANVSKINFYAYERVKNLDYIVISNPQCDIYASGATISNEWDLDYPDNCVYYGTIIGYSGSTAQTYAEAYNYNFKAIESIPLGDVNFDGSITAADAATALGGYAAESATGVPTLIPLQEKLGDANYDGAVTATDAAKILSYYAFTATSGADSSVTFEEFLKQN